MKGSDIESLSAMCRFFDCKHESEPGCAVRQALERGTLSEKRLISWIKLQKELKHMEKKKADKVREYIKRYPPRNDRTRIY